MTDALQHVSVRYRRRKGFYVVSEPERSNVIVISRFWHRTRALVDQYLGIILPIVPPDAPPFPTQPLGKTPA